MTKQTRLKKLTKHEIPEDIFQQLGEPINGLSIEQFRAKINALVSYYDYCFKSAKKETLWNTDREGVERILNKTADLIGEVENASSSVLSRINTAAQILANSQITNPFDISALLYHGCDNLEALRNIESACKKTIELFGGEHQSRPSTTSIKVRFVCYIIHLVHEYFIVDSPIVNGIKISYYSGGLFYKLVGNVFHEGENVAYSIRQAKKRYQQYLSGDKDWWVENVDKMSVNSMDFEASLAAGVIPETEQMPVLLFKRNLNKFQLE